MPGQGVTLNVMARVYFRQSGKCADCGIKSTSGKPGDWKGLRDGLWFNKSGMEYHHIVPYQKSKSSHESNILMLCRPCHMKRHKKMRIEKQRQEIIRATPTLT